MDPAHPRFAKGLAVFPTVDGGDAAMKPSAELYAILDHIDDAIRGLDDVLEHPPSRLRVLGHLVVARGKIVKIRRAVSMRATALPGGAL